MNPVPRVAAEPLGFEPRFRAVQILLGLQNFSLQRKENMAVCVLAAPGAGSRNPMCAQLKIGCPRGLPVQT